MSRSTRYTARILPGLFFTVAPLFALAQIVPCTNDCDFNALITLAGNIVHFLLFDLAMPLAAVAFAYAGFLLLTQGGNEANLSKAKTIFWYVLLGLIVAFGAWAIVKFVAAVLFKPEFQVTN